MKLMLILITVLFYVIPNQAQTNYYTATKTFYENGYTYQCDVSSSKMVDLYNKTNKWININLKYKDTGENYVMGDVGPSLMQYDGQMESKCESIVNEAFSNAEKQRIKGYGLTISMYLNSTTGRVSGVQFQFLSIDPYATIPISVYRKIEVELIKNICFKTTPEGAKLNYILYWWIQEPK